MRFNFIGILKKQREWSDDRYRTPVNVMFAQMSEKQGIKMFKEQAVAAIVKEYKQLHNMNTFGGVCPEDLNPKQKWYALCAITLIKEKRSEKIKVRACEDDRAQRSYITKEEAAAPTVSMD